MSSIPSNFLHSFSNSLSQYAEQNGEKVVFALCITATTILASRYFSKSQETGSSSQSLSALECTYPYILNRDGILCHKPRQGTSCYTCSPEARSAEESAMPVVSGPARNNGAELTEEGHFIGWHISVNGSH